MPRRAAAGSRHLANFVVATLPHEPLMQMILP
jgi:hypothetical protein